MIVSTTAATQRNPPQEVKSTFNEKRVIKRMKVKLICFKPRESVWKDLSLEGNKLVKLSTFHLPLHQTEMLDLYLATKMLWIFKGTLWHIVMWDKGVLLRWQQRHPLTSHGQLSCRKWLFSSLYLCLEAEDCDSYANHCCYSHCKKHCFSVIIAAKHTHSDLREMHTSLKKIPAFA